ncbi:MAG: acyl--CoA ligase [Proteobacteria bacterium]|nr:acyl--CoA ligase [Pseudomonadota bacterium]
MSIADQNALAEQFAAYRAGRHAVESTELPATVPELLWRAEQRFGDAEAIHFIEDGKQLTFSELACSVRRMADSLWRLGVRHGTHVAVMLPNRIEYPVTWLALATLGAVMVPVITSYTARELQFLVEDADVSFLVIDSAYRERLDDASWADRVKPVLIAVGATEDAADGPNNFHELLRAGSDDFVPPEGPRADDLLNIQYTSGTTGLPKGVMQSHRFWIQAGCTPMLYWKQLGIRRILSDHPFHYIDPQWMLLAGLYGGAHVDYTRRMSVRHFMGWLKERGSNLAWFPDPLLKLQESPAEKDHQVKVFLAYHFSAEMLKEGQRRFGARFSEAYGMTEIGLGLSVPSEVSDEAALGTCGLPGPWREARIVGEDGQDVPRGQPGELWIRGAGIFDGYYKRPQANAASFVDGWFRTGDVFMQDERGYYRILGRLKDMIKRSGENISATEVEQVLRELDQVEDVAAVPVPDDARDEEVKVYLMLHEGVDASALPPEAVLAHCAARLAKFKIPRYIAYVDDLPYTPSEKVAKHRLIKGVEDLRTGAYDAVERVWR